MNDKININRPYGDVVISVRNDIDRSIINEIFRENVYDFHGYQIKDGSSVLDIGANIGVFTLLVLAIAFEENKKVDIYAVEPEEHNLELLKENMKNNAVLFSRGSTVTIIEKGVSEANGYAYIDNNSGNSSLNSDDRNQKVELVSFDELISEIESDSFSFTKIDIEGSEVGMIKGASRASLQKTHFYAIEFDERNSENDFIEIIKPFLKDFSMRTWGIPAVGCNLFFENHRWKDENWCYS